MKHKSLYLLCFLILPLFLFCVGSTVYAVSNPLGQPTQAVTPKIEKYKVDDKADAKNDLERYRIHFQRDEDWNPFGKDEVAQTVNNVTNFFFEMNKLVVSITDFGIENLYQLDVLDDFADNVGSFVGDIYERLLSNIVMTLFIIICLNAFIIYSVKGNMQEALKRGVLIFALIGIGVGVLGNASSVIRGTNNVGKSLNNVIMNSTSAIGGDVDYQNENSGINKIRNQYFDMTLYKPYLIMNYGTVNEDSIKQKSKERIDNILDIKIKDKESENSLKEKIDTEVKDYKNTSIKQSNVFGQLGISIFTLVITVVVSFIFLAISFGKVIFSAFALILFIFLVFSWLLSFIPNLELSVFKSFALTIGYIILSACMTFLFVVVGFAIDLSNAVVNPDSQEAYFLNVIFLMIVLFVLYKKRHEIISFVTRGNLTLSPQKLGAEAIQKSQNEWNKRRQKQAENKQLKRQKQQNDKPMPVFIVNPNNKDNDLKRNQQQSSSNGAANNKNFKRRSQQEDISMSKDPSYSTVSPSFNDSNQQKGANHEEGMHRDVTKPKDIKRTPQTMTSNSPNLSQHPKEVIRTNQPPTGLKTDNKQVQSSYDKDVEKRQIQSGQNNQFERRSKSEQNNQYQRTPQNNKDDVKKRINHQKDINKHGK
ncbi:MULTISPECIES: CD3337/EF1877 family mobilome membrane protein [Staphylococcus]|uniref:CD3337/EF1877 family mobilome membrane protein n=1 Tax=Staphylococcus TaxID=1279 RepID=UPI0005C7AA25|nr:MULTISPECIES: membrane protein [Staphylococcus]MDG4944206.1 hypothetical protein [Staphylococcus agnetis]HDH6082991.1 hypothetical protein [Staphylococcus aureus]